MDLAAKVLASAGRALPCRPNRDDGKGVGVGGGRDIGAFASICLISNNIVGPGIWQLPGLLQQCGWVPCLVVLCLVVLWTTQGGLYLARAISKFRGNANFAHRVEYLSASHALLPFWAYVLSALALCFSLFSQNVANIVLAAQVSDQMLLNVFGRTCALVMSASNEGGIVPPGWCVANDNDLTLDNSLYGSAYVVTGGFLFVLLLAVPLSFVNLDDNMGVQVLGFLLTVMCVLVWTANAFATGLTGKFVTAFGTGDGDVRDFAPLVPLILFNFAYVPTQPSWLSEKSPAVRVSRTMAFAIAAATTQIILVGVFGALVGEIDGGPETSFATFISAGGNEETSSGFPNVWLASRIMTFIFPFANVLTAIPIFSIILRYNILQLHGVNVPVWAANIVALLGPWLVAIFFYPGKGIALWSSWSSAFVGVAVSFLIPVALFLATAAHEATGAPPIEPPLSLHVASEAVAGGAAAGAKGQGAAAVGAAALEGVMGGAAEAPVEGVKAADGAPPPLTIIMSPLVRANSGSFRASIGTPRGGGSPRAGEAEAASASPVSARGGTPRAIAWGETSGNSSPADWGTPRSVVSPEAPLILPPCATAAEDLDEDIHAIPRVCGGGGRSCEVAYALALFAIAIALALATVGLQITTVALGDAADPPSDTPDVPPSPDSEMRMM